jgi:hypothetical protein
VADADVVKLATFTDELPADDDAIIAAHQTDFGWRGLTARGELLNVRSRNGRKAELPQDNVIMMRGNVAVSRRAIERGETRIDEYLAHHGRAMTYLAMNEPAAALREAEAAMAIAPTLYARFNRAMILLELGRWSEGFEQYWQCELSPTLMRAPVKAALDRGLEPWRGQELIGKRLLLVHAHGFGDTIMALRYAKQLRDYNDVKLVVPAALAQLAQQLGPVVDPGEPADYFCPMLHLVGLLEHGPGSVRSAFPYLEIGHPLLPHIGRERIGLAWSCATQNSGDYERSIPLDQLVQALPNAELHSVQTQGQGEAQALGVQVHDFQDFTACASLMMQMDRIVSVDTAALHLAGAIGHPRVEGLLGHWASWRWRAQWYSNVTLFRQTSNNNWHTALDQLEPP